MNATVVRTFLPSTYARFSVASSHSSSLREENRKRFVSNRTSDFCSPHTFSRPISTTTAKFPSSSLSSASNDMKVLEKAMQDGNIRVVERKLKEMEDFDGLSPRSLREVVYLCSGQGMFDKAKKAEQILETHRKLDHSDIHARLERLLEEGSQEAFFATLRRSLSEGFPFPSLETCNRFLSQLAQQHEWDWAMELLAEYRLLNQPLPETGVRALVSSLRMAQEAQLLMSLLQWCERSGPLDVWYYNQALEVYAAKGSIRALRLLCAHFRQLGVVPNATSRSIVQGVCEQLHQPELATKMLY